MMKNRITFILTLFLLLFCAPQLQVDSEAQITMKKCSVCGRPVSNCDYKGNHPKCSVCGKVKENCPYRGNHPVFKETEIPNGYQYMVNGVQFTMIRVEGNGNPYYIGETEVTQALWQVVMGSLPSEISSSSWDVRGSKRPVCYVNCDDCERFIRKLNSLTGKYFRLPSESEWVYAAKGGMYTRGYEYSGSNNIDDVAWYISNTKKRGTRDVRTKRPNELGLYDMSGNVWEWTSTPSGSFRIQCGGCWDYDDEYCSSSDRIQGMPSSRYRNNGLRLAL